ncbi:MAG: glycoside hydrolase domain-containing protein [Planctomycetota bacterium]
MRQVLVAVMTLSGALYAAGAPGAETSAAPGPGAGTTILGAGSYWRTHATYRGKVVPVELLKEADPAAVAPKALDGAFETPLPPDGWMRPEFDDSDWSRASNPFRGGVSGHAEGYGDFGVALFAGRGKFETKDPAAVRKLTLAMTYAGGVVVYLNGQEVARASLPEGKIDPLTPAQTYPADAYVDAAGKLVENRFTDNPSVGKRVRRFGPVELPVKILRKGVNILAVEVHRSAFRAEAVKWTKAENNFAHWPHIGLGELHLVADGPSVIPNVDRPAGVQVWNQDVNRVFSLVEYGDPNEKLKAVKLVVARNGCCSGQVVIGSTEAISGAQARVGDLVQAAGGGKIPASAIRLRYGMPSTTAMSASHAGLALEGYTPVPAFALLEDEPPSKVEPQALPPRPAARARLGLPAKIAPAALLPVWVTVRVPKDAPPGNYTGTLTVSATGVSETKIPIDLEVIEWTIPNPADFRTWVSIYQSPESEAIQYNVPMWSEEHWKLMERDFQLMGELGNRFLCIPLVNHTQFGNDSCMIPWIKQPDLPAGAAQAGGGYTQDFTVYDRYVALAAKYCTLKVVSYQVYLSQGWNVPGPDNPTFVTVKDPAGGKSEPMKLPAYGTEESRKLWKPFFEEIKAHGRKAGLGQDAAIALGISQDCGIHKDVVAFFKEIVPEAGWHYGAHGREQTKGFIFSEYLYVPWEIPSPRVTRNYGWQNKPTVLICQRMYEANQPPEVTRTIGERALLLGDNGAGRMGIDYWPVKGSVESPGGRGLFNRWPESSSGQRSPFIYNLALPGKAGAVASIKYEAMREGFQESEARIFVEEAILSKKISGERAERAQNLLDRRAQICRLLHSRWESEAMAATPDEGWQKLSADLYRLAAEVAGKTGGK